MFKFLIWVLLFASSVYIINTNDYVQLMERLKSGYDWCKKNIQVEPAYRKSLIQETHRNLSFPDQNSKNRWRY